MQVVWDSHLVGIKKLLHTFFVHNLTILMVLMGTSVYFYCIDVTLKEKKKIAEAKQK